jgi:brefeldin A-resistance guanine nucleotide exchange factor 1
MFTNLFLHSLLPSSMLQMEDFLSGASVIPLRGNAPSQPQPRSDGLLSALSSYLMTPYSSTEQVPEATNSDVESTLCTIDCITSCRLEALFSAVRALEALAHERTVARLKLEGDETTQNLQYNQPNRNSEGQYVLSYDPASVFLLETMVSILRQTPQHIEELW